MFQSTIQVALACAVVVFVTQSASSQPAAPNQPATPQAPPVQQPSAGQPNSQQFQEDFDKDPVSGWDFRSKHAFVSTGNGRALATQGGALWNAAGEVSDFTMKVRFGFDRGIALVDFRNARRYGVPDRYVLILSATGVGLIRVQHQPSEVQEKELASAKLSLARQTWHEAIIRAKDGQIDVWIDGKGVLSVCDPQPLGAGICALGVESGTALFDQVILTPQGKPSRGGLVSDPASWSSWSDARMSSRAGSTANTSNSRGGSSVRGRTSGNAPTTIVVP